MSLRIQPIYDGENAGEAFEKVNLAMARTDLLNLTNVLTCNRFGRWKTITLTEATTFQIVTEVESHLDGIRVGIPNLSASPVVGVRAAVAFMLDFVSGSWYSHPYPDGANWQPCTWNGATSATLPALLHPEVPSVTYSDLMGHRSPARTSGAVRPLVMVRLQYPAGSVVTVPYQEFYGWRTDGIWRPMRVSKQAVLGVDVPANFTSTTTIDTGAPIPIIRYLSRTAGYQFMHCGDSTVEGLGRNTRGFGAVPMTAVALSSPSAPVEYYNCGLHAQGPVTYGRMIPSYIDSVRPTHLFYSPYSINDTPVGGMNSGTLQRLYHELARVMEAQRTTGRPCHLILLEGLPCNPSFRDTGAGDALRLAMNAELHGYTGAVVPAGYAAAISGAVDPDGQTLIADGLTSDGVHPNEAGYGELASVLIPYLLDL